MRCTIHSLPSLLLIIPMMLVLLTARSHAETQIIVGSKAPEFKAALQFWLDDNDSESLPELARLGLAGNDAARLLLFFLRHREDLNSSWVPGWIIRAITPYFHQDDQAGTLSAGGG